MELDAEGVIRAQLINPAFGRAPDIGHYGHRRRDRPEPPAKGHFMPLCNGRFVLGPGACNFLVCTAVLVGMAVLFVFQLPLLNKYVGAVVAHIGIVLHALTIIFFVWTCTTDPGVIPNDMTLREYAALSPKSADEAGFRRHYCSKCRLTRPPRSYHCSECGVCVRRQDQHLLFGGICVGQRNFPQYFLLNLFETLLSIYLIMVTSHVLRETLENSPPYTESTFNLLGLILSMAYALVLFISPQTGFVILIYRLTLLSQDRTLREEFRIMRGYENRVVQAGNCCRSWWRMFFPSSRAKSFFRPTTPAEAARAAALQSAQSWADLLLIGPEVTRVLDQANNNWNQDGSSSSTVPQPMSGIPYKDLTDAYVRSGDLRVGIRADDYRKLAESAATTSNDLSKAKAKLKDAQSLPLIDNGDLPTLPGTRIHHPIHETGAHDVQTRLRLHRQLQQLPRTELSYRMNQTSLTTMSEHGIPRCDLAPNQRNEFVQTARAAQIQQIIELCLRRDRIGLVELARRINVGALIGLMDLEPDNLQLLEFRDGTPLLFTRPLPLGAARQALHRQLVIQRNREIRTNPANHWLGSYQMIAAGLMRPDQFNLLRRLTRIRNNQGPNRI